MSYVRQFLSGLSLATIQTPLILNLTCHEVSGEIH